MNQHTPAPDALRASLATIAAAFAPARSDAEPVRVRRLHLRDARPATDPQAWAAADAPIPASNGVLYLHDDFLTVEVRVDRMFIARRDDDTPQIDVVRGLLGDGLVIDARAVRLAVPDIDDRLAEAWRADDL